MRRSATLLSGLLLLVACGESPTAPTSRAPVPAEALSQAREHPIEVSCVAVNTPGAYTATISWTRVKVLNVSLTTDDGTLITSLARPKRKGTVTFTPTSATLGFRLDDGVQTIAQGGCAAA